MATQNRLRLDEIEPRVCDVASRCLSIERDRLSLRDRLIEDLHCDSLCLVDLMMKLEDVFSVALLDASLSPACKSVFTRPSFCLGDLAELVYLQQGTGLPDRNRRRPRTGAASGCLVPFTQLDGRWQQRASSGRWLLEPIEIDGENPQFRRRSDGMRCVLVPSANVVIGCDSPGVPGDERPQHIVEIESFLIDAEPVSTTAYCRFLNSIGDVAPEVLADWFVLDPHDNRREHLPLQCAVDWRPIPGTERWPMILVSWFGANAYALWANGWDWNLYRDQDREIAPSFLPTEAQWEYAARGARFQPYPWGDSSPTMKRMRYGQHRRSTAYRLDTIPLADVNDELGMSPFGLHHMAGNVWQWCRDWYDEAFYRRPDATRANPVNRTPTQVRSERGGSWIGPAELCRSSFRRGRVPLARGRCLGFRCVSSVKDAPGD